MKNSTVERSKKLEAILFCNHELYLYRMHDGLDRYRCRLCNTRVKIIKQKGFNDGLMDRL
jgi:hypothetical protein